MARNQRQSRQVAPPLPDTHNGQDGEGTDGSVCLGDTSRSLEVDQVRVLLELRLRNNEERGGSDGRVQK